MGGSGLDVQESPPAGRPTLWRLGIVLREGNLGDPQLWGESHPIALCSDAEASSRDTGMLFPARSQTSVS